MAEPAAQAEGFPPPSSSPLDAELRSNLKRNLEALRTARPELHGRLISARPVTFCRGVITAAGSRTLVQRDPVTSHSLLLCPGGEPLKNLDGQVAQVQAGLAKGQRAGLCGIGDGHLLSRLASRDENPLRALGHRGPIYVIEPEAEVVLGAMTLHDWTGADGPIAQPRCLWFVGPDWEAELRRTLAGDPFLPVPTLLLSLGRHGANISATVDRVQADLRANDRELARRAERECAAISRERLLAALGAVGGEPGAKPAQPLRVLVPTSRFSRVLQHSARDLADGLERLGCDVRLVIEPTDHHVVTTRALRRVLAEFRPELVVSIDHLRRDTADAFPPGLPVACWVQDDFPHLTTREAAASIGPRDFVLSPSGPRYVREFGYPARQCIYLGKLTRVPTALVDTSDAARSVARGTTPTDDLAFVSNASHLPEPQLAELAASAAGPAGALLRAAGPRVIAVYRDGGRVTTIAEMAALVARAERDADSPAVPSAERAALSLRLFNTLNNTLYRQQALRWIAAAADRLGLRLGLYGHGWGDNPEFCRFARGPVAYGRDLEALTRRTAINLQIVPYSCLHQRLLDGLVAGGFFLVRAHPDDAVARGLLRLVRSLPREARTAEDARRVLGGGRRAELESLLTEIAVLHPGDATDPVALCREHCERRLEHVYADLPRLDEVSFADGASAERLIRRFIADGDARRAIAGEQRRFVEMHLTYEGGMRRVLGEVRRLIAGEAPAPGCPGTPGTLGTLGIGEAAA